ncbi:hypothetical protein DXM29_13520 [Agrobacterium tumefaciens]|jgi:hypothetical protein|nr:hypothetical protein DXM29_13520 [Agrobacterium tumefaciens]
MMAMAAESRRAAFGDLRFCGKAYPRIPVFSQGMAIFTIYVLAMAKYIDYVNYAAHYPPRRIGFYAMPHR